MAYKVAYLQRLLIKVPGLELSKEISLMTEVSHCFFAWIGFSFIPILHFTYSIMQREENIMKVTWTSLINVSI